MSKKILTLAIACCFAVSGCATVSTVAETKEQICKRKAAAIRAAQATIAAFEAVCPFETPEERAAREGLER